MKMDQRNPGGEGPGDLRKKGCEVFQARGKGDLKQFTQSTGMGSLGGSMGGHDKMNKSHGSGLSGSTVTGSSKACK